MCSTPVSFTAKCFHSIRILNEHTEEGKPSGGPTDKCSLKPAVGHLLLYIKVLNICQENILKDLTSNVFEVMRHNGKVHFISVTSFVQMLIISCSHSPAAFSLYPFRQCLFGPCEVLTQYYEMAHSCEHFMALKFLNL